MKVAFLYAGQGSQQVGMGKDLYETFETYRKVIDRVDLGRGYRDLMHDGPAEKLLETQYTQPCMAAFAAGVTAVLKENGIVPDIAAGLSLGEYSALHCAGVYDDATLVELVAFRGAEMEKAARGIDCKMTAVLNLDRHELERVCAEAKQYGHVDVVNYNCPGQYVIGGDRYAVEQAEALAKEKGAKRCIPLNVSGPFHTVYMKPAAKALEEKFKIIPFKPLKIPVVFNTTADMIQPHETVPSLLVKQVHNSVYFEDSIHRLLQTGVKTIVEIGPGKALSSFVKKISKEVTIYNIETAEDLHQMINRSKENLI